MANETIGFIKCAITGERAEVRRYATGKRKFYYVSSAGMITPNLPAGQSWIEQNATFFDDSEKLTFNEQKTDAPTKPIERPPIIQTIDATGSAKNYPKQKQKRSLWEHLINDDE